MIHFCENTGVRIAKPGCCKSCDPMNGQDEVIEMPDGSLKIVGEKKPAAEAAKGESKDSAKKG